MPLKANFANVGQILPPDEYELILDSHKELQTKKGDTMAQLVFRVADGEFKGKTVKRGYMIEGDGAYYLMEALITLGADPEELSPEGQTGEDEGVDLDDIIKRCYNVHVMGQVGVRESDDGKKYADLKEIRAIR